MSQTIHPRGLYTLFFTEMWERFSYYGMRALLVLYLVKYFKFSDMAAGQIYGLYTSLVYLTPLAGGYLADRYIGYSRAIIAGGILMALGHISMSFDSLGMMYTGLGLLVAGNGFFKPNISSLVSSLYDDMPQSKDSGYTIFYMGINLGAFLGPLICGFLGEYYGWHYGFGVAGAGMVIGLFVFLAGKKHLPFHREHDVHPVIDDRLANVEKDRMKVIGILAMFSVFFWMAFEQAGSSMNLYADRYTDRNVAGFEIPASVLQSVNPLLILLLAPFFSLVWRKRNISFPVKFAFGLFFLGAGFIVLAWGAAGAGLDNRSGLSWLLVAYFFHTVGELFLSPVGLSMVSKLAPVKYASLFFGLWFLSNAVSHYLAGALSGYMTMAGSLSSFFMIFVVNSFAAAVLLLFFRRGIFRLAHGVN